MPKPKKSKVEPVPKEETREEEARRLINQGQRKNIPSAEKHKGPGSTRKAQSNEV